MPPGSVSARLHFLALSGSFRARRRQPPPPPLPDDDFLRRLAKVEAAENARRQSAAKAAAPAAIVGECVDGDGDGDGAPPSPRLPLSPQLSPRPSPVVEDRVPAQLPPQRLPPPHELPMSKSHARILASFRQTRSRSRVTLPGGPTARFAAADEADSRASTLWGQVREFVRWLGGEREGRRAEEGRRAKAAARKAEKRMRQEKAAKAHSERRAASERERSEAAERAQHERVRAAHEADVLSAMLANPTAPSAAADAAAAAQHARVELAKALPADMQSARPGADLWSKFGGPAIEAMLGDIDLVDARYLVDLAERRGVLPRWQDVPPAARIGPSEVWRLRFAWHEYDCLAILALS